MYLVKLKTKAAMLLSDLTGKTFTVGQVTATGNGANKWLILQPKSIGSAAAKAKGTVMLKVTGNKQLIGLAGKTVTVGKAPVMGAGGAGKWLALHPVAAAAKGAAVKGAIAGGGGATVILTAAPAGKGAAVKGAAGKVVELEGAALKTALADAKIAGAKAATASKGALAASKSGAIGGAAKAATGGTIWTGKGLSVGLGLGLGAWGPVILVAGGAAAWYGYKKYRKSADGELDTPETDTEIKEALA
jgi:hypothetical protein